MGSSKFRTRQRDHPSELAAADKAAISVAPRGIVHIGDAFGIPFARVPDGDDCLDHPPMLRPLGLPPQELFRASSAIVPPLRGDRRRSSDGAIAADSAFYDHE